MTVLTTQSDEDLLWLARAGDEDAFATLYRRRQGGIYRFALRMSGSSAVAEDVTQEVFLALVREGQQFDPARGSLLAYLFGIARHHLLRRLERDRFLVPLDEEPGDGNLTAQEGFIASCDPLGDLTRHEMIESVRQAVLTLPAHYREVVVLCELEEMSYVEAAEVMGCVLGTVRSRLHRARALLVEKLRQTGKPDSAAPQASTARCFV